MKAIMVNEEQGFGGNMSGMTNRVKGNRKLGGSISDLSDNRAFWNSILSHFGMSADDVPSNGGGGGGGGGLFVTGTETAIKNFKEMVSNYSNGLYQANVNHRTGGYVTITRTDKKGLLTPGQSVLINTLIQAADPSKKQIDIALHENSNNVFVGEMHSGEIDIADIRAVGFETEFCTAIGLLAHEVGEQIQYQRNFNGDESHKLAITAYENPANESVRENGDARRVKYTNNDYVAPNGKLIEGSIRDGEMRIDYKYNDVIRTISIIIRNNNVTSVKDITPKSN